MVLAGACPYVRVVHSHIEGSFGGFSLGPGNRLVKD